MPPVSSICVYCGHKMGSSPEFQEAAQELGEILAKESIRLVYGGGKLGLMGTVAGAARDAGGDVFGVIPEFLVSLEGKLDGVRHEVVETMHERKMRMFEEADAFVILPGGIGTLEEVVELVSWARLDLHKKPAILLNIKDYWSPLIDLLHHAVDEGFADPKLKSDVEVVASPKDVLSAIEQRSLRHFS